ncbi:MAG: DUF1330 domain-containing protein [Maricaulaceae bacterium]
MPENMLPDNMPTETQIVALMALPLDAPVAVLNMFRFRERAKYNEGDPEYGSEAANISGQEAMARYSEAAGAFLTGLGGHVEFNAPVDQIMIGPEAPTWHVTAIMYFPTRAAFVKMLNDPAFQHASRHRKAALDGHYMLHLDGSAFTV